MLDVTKNAITKLVRDGHLSVRRIPGTRPRVLLQEVMALARSSVARESGDRGAAV